ncbi:GPI-linked NAD(P)(+)--arginine ADP-ribosyltransferase 1 isoform X3 [Carassius gibelio]|uniref:GPI-linked NAD(P)(+)--arginine ADP-ribosyltransferase 1 isoform X2 n=1 Tax=Carassius gibelio TaxID=101364 RepID=UPI0022793B91|nr:GPI-linked NAD(P)(+)--arginine ADP-ribosyltransferase 1 isoform X2 [Carassius gibelio]XP_052406003.1 GPI-linked NAD(P)(+)--arginine ADP-ribosyltransferase 1 isoform X3 [Carassius gibelio]
MGSLRFHAFLLLLLYTTVVQISAVATHMGLFPEAADYSFYNCRKEMLQMVTKSGGLLQTELNNNKDFKTMWKNTTCKKAIPGSTPEHMTALKSYVEASSEFRKTFKKSVQNHNKSRSTYRDEFPFKSLFFLLTDAMNLTDHKECPTVYSGTGKGYITKIGEKVRFVSFFPAKLKSADATEDASIGEDTGTVFSITSCSVINLDDYGCSSEKIDALISPTEVFTVKDITAVKNNDYDYINITLVHSHFHSSSDCSSLVSSPEESKESSSSFLSSSFLNLTASFLMLCFYTLILR